MDAGGTTPWMGEVEQSRKLEPRATHDYRDIGGRVKSGAVTEEAKAENGSLYREKKTFSDESFNV